MAAKKPEKTDPEGAGGDKPAKSETGKKAARAPRAQQSAPAPAKAAGAPKAEETPAKPLTKLASLLASAKIDTRRLLATSRRLERLTSEDRAIRLAKRRARKGGEGATPETRKPRSGRPVTPRALRAAVLGEPISGPTKTRILRAVNAVLEQKKAEKVDLRALF